MKIIKSNEKALRILFYFNTFLIFSVLFIDFLICVLGRPDAQEDYLYKYTKNLPLRVLLILLIFISILFLLRIYLFIRKKYQSAALDSLLLIGTIVLLPVLFITTYNAGNYYYSYTREIDHFMKLDDQYIDAFFSEDYEIIQDYIPKKEDLIQYEYIYRSKAFTFMGSGKLMCINMETIFDPIIFDQLEAGLASGIFSDVTEEYSDVNPSKEFKIYRFKDTQELEFYVLINRGQNKIIYSIAHNVYIFTKYKNPFSLEAFILRDRLDPYFIYKES